MTVAAPAGASPKVEPKASESAIVDQSHPVRNLSGVVKDEKGGPIIGASVVVKGTTNGSITNLDGQFTLSNVPAGATVEVSYIGFTPQSKKVSGDTRNLNFVLSEATEDLDEVVVVGYGVQRKRDLSGSVASVKGDVVNEYANVSVATALTGRISGVQVQQSSGQPGGGIQVRVRGSNSIKGSNEPLWIINGFPGDINMINTSDIESVEVLKDASATAIYGSRGANGVVIITTRKAGEGKVNVEYNASFGVQSCIKQLDLLNAEEYMDYLNQKAAVNGKSAVYTDAEIAAETTDTNWQKEVFRNALVTDHSVNITGGTDKIRNSFGLSYFDQDGVIKESGYRRITLRSSQDFKISKFISLSSNIILSRADQDQMNSQGGSNGTTVIGSMLILPPVSTVKYDDGSWNDFTGQPIAPMNPLAYLYEVQHKFFANRVMANAMLTVRPIPELTIQISGNITNKDSRTDYYKSLKYPNSQGAASTTIGNTTDLTSNNIVTYDKTFGGKHHLNVMGGFTYESNTTKAVSSGTAEGFLSDVTNVYDLDGAEVKGLPSSSYSDWRLYSFLGRANYNYGDRYLLTASIRADGSSRYSKGNKWGYFPSAAAAWRLSQEQFLNDVEWLSDLKLRLSYGKTGSTAISPYSTQNTLSTQNVVFDKNTVVAYCPSDTYTGDLRWETTAQTNVGIDFAAFNSRFRFTADYYYKKTTDLLNSVEMPRSSGYTTALRNIGSVENKGFELQVDGRIIDSDVKWDLGFNFTRNRSKVLKLADSKDIFGSTISSSVFNDQINILREGKEMYLFYGYVEDGLDENGHIVYKDLDGDGSITSADRDIIGNPNPDFLLNFNTTVSWKGFSLSAFFQGSFGNDIFSISMANLAYNYSYNGNTLRDVYLNHWTAENTNAKYPAFDQTSYRVSDRFVYDGTYLRLKNIELAYDIPLKKNKTLKRCRVYVSGQNLVTITSYPFWDPDVNAKGTGSSMMQGIDWYSYPSARTYTAGLKLIF
jgi:TonB-linked SusC/RagA family outer membrane protein